MSESIPHVLAVARRFWCRWPRDVDDAREDYEFARANDDVEYFRVRPGGQPVQLWLPERHELGEPVDVDCAVREGKWWVWEARREVVVFDA